MTNSNDKVCSSKKYKGDLNGMIQGLEGGNWQVFNFRIII